MYFYLVEFACDPNDPIRVFLLDEKMYDDWCQCEPQQGYKHFKSLWHGEVESIHSAWNDAREIVIHDPR